MPLSTTLEDLVGIEHCKLGFYQELQQKVEQLKVSNQELETKRNKIQAILDGVTDMMAVLSENLEIQTVNHIFFKWFPNVSPEGRYCYEVFRNQTSPCQDCPVLRSLTLGEIVKDVCIYKVDGRFRHFEMIASPLRGGPGGVPQVLLFKRDVTLEKEFQAQFYQAEKMATVGTLAAGVAHEINNPLTAISGFAEGLQRRLTRMEGEGNEEMLADFGEYTEIIITECLRCRDIVQTLLTFSRPVSASLSTVDLNICIKDTLFILKHHLKEHHDIAVTTELDQHLPLIKGDESQLKQVIINLFTNAFDATGDRGKILIKTMANIQGEAELIVKDSGCGIPLDQQDKLFEPFFTTKPVGKGVGIGLSTCYSIVKKHKGNITVTSGEGKGSSFRVVIPGMMP